MVYFAYENSKIGSNFAQFVFSEWVNGAYILGKYYPKIVINWDLI